MSIKKMYTYEESATRILAEKAYRSVKEVEADIDKIYEMVKDNLALIQVYEKNIERSMRIEVDVNRPSVKNSPRGRIDLKPELIKNLNKHFVSVQAMYDARQQLETIEAKLRMSAKLLGGSTGSAFTALEQVRKYINKGVEKSLTFLNSSASESLPEEFGKFVEKMVTICSRALTYEDSNTFTYMFVNKGESLVYTAFIQLKDLIDDKGARLPELYVVVSFELNKTKLSNRYYMDVLFEFEPPSDKLLVTEINPAKMSDIANTLAELLNVSHYANSIQRIPIKMLISPELLTRDLFSCSEYVDSIIVPDDNDTIIEFWLKPDVTDRPLINDIISQLYLDFRALSTATKAHIRASVDTKKKDGVKHQVISFIVTRASGAPAASPEDLEFMKEQFNLSDATIAKILMTINKE